MGNSVDKVPKEESDEITKETGFTNPQIQKIYERFVQLDKGDKGYLSRNDLHAIPEFAINPLDTPDKMPNSSVNKVKLVFHLFDSNHGGTISKTEVLDVLRYMVGTNIGGDNLSQIAERVMVEACRDERDVYEGNMELTFESFMAAMSESVVESKMAVRFQ